MAAEERINDLDEQPAVGDQTEGLEGREGWMEGLGG